LDVTEHSEKVAGLDVHLRRTGDVPILYLHGVPTHSHDWVPFLERTGGIAPDLPGFGKSAKPGDFDHSIAGYDRFLEAFVDQLEPERFSLVLHDWGSVGLALAQRFPERVERLVLFSVVPFLPGFRWHRVARAWRTPGVGELLMGATTRWGLRRELPTELADSAWDAFDHGTQRAILKLYRSAPPDVLAQAGERLDEIRAPALILWSEDDPYIGAEFGQAHADALGGETTLEMVRGGHWPWLRTPELIDRTADFLKRS
jgi:pimeloyl-ACP methyl ester carboxylesterase